MNLLVSLAPVRLVSNTYDTQPTKYMVLDSCYFVSTRHVCRDKAFVVKYGKREKSEGSTIHFPNKSGNQWIVLGLTIANKLPLGREPHNLD